MTEKRRLTVNMCDLAVLFALRINEVQGYLDLETGKILEINSGTWHLLEELNEELYTADGDQTMPLEDLLAQRPEIPGWQKRALVEANRIKLNGGQRLIAVTPDPQDDYRDMERFIATLEDKQLADELLTIIRKRGAFRNFKDTLVHNSRLQKAWLVFREICIEERVREWLDSYGIEPVE